MTTIGDIYDFLNEIMPFSLQESWDNSGFLAGDAAQPVTSVLTCLDITSKTVDEAEKLGAQLIVSHHPVIFQPIRSVTADSVVYKLVRKNISAICCHTNADIAPCGTNGIAYEMMKDSLSLGECSPLEMLPNGNGIGWICGCEPVHASELAAKLEDIFGCPVRYSRTDKLIKRLGFCSGSGGSMLEEAVSAGCDALITGDVKHDRFVEADNIGTALFDCTHYATEVPFASAAAGYISERFPDIAAYVSESGADYIAFSDADRQNT